VAIISTEEASTKACIVQRDGSFAVRLMLSEKMFCLMK